ncbi:MAG: pentapeptide repeat-containing protein [Anaerolineae bacterium]|nr:pentapeptide repeat-containing protein [Anaerolineae bacterium]
MAQKIREPQGYPTKDAAQRANDDMWRSFKKQFQEKPITYGTILVLFGFFVGGVLFHYQPSWGEENNNLFGYLTNFATELLGVVFTIFIVNEFQKRRDRKQLARELLAAIKHGGPDNAQQAISIIKSYDDELGWYSGENSLLAGQDFADANLEGIDFRHANLTGAIFMGSLLRKSNFLRANLKDANLMVANLEGAHMPKADLRDAKMLGTKLRNAILEDAKMTEAKLGMNDLVDANLIRVDLEGITIFEADMQGANLSLANLQDATIGECNLKGTNFYAANLKGVTFPNSEFSDQTILPDAQNIAANQYENWFHFGLSSRVDGNQFDKTYNPEQGPDQMMKYTNSAHPEFWDPCVEISSDIPNFPQLKIWYCYKKGIPLPYTIDEGGDIVFST